MKGDTGDMGDTGMQGAAGLACWDLNGNSACDTGTEDANDDGVCDALDCQGEDAPERLILTVGKVGITMQIFLEFQ